MRTTMGFATRFRKTAAQATAVATEGTEQETFFDLAAKLEPKIWGRLPGEWPEYLRKFVFLHGSVYGSASNEVHNAPLSGWRGNDFLPSLIEAVALRESLLQDLSPSLRQRITDGLDPDSLTDEERIQLYRLWLRVSEPLRYRPPRGCYELSGCGRFCIPRDSVGIDDIGGMVDIRRHKIYRDRLYAAVRHRFEEAALETERPDVFIAKLGYASFNQEERAESGLLDAFYTYTESQGAVPRNKRGYTSQIWWFFVQPMDNGFIACWPAVTMTRRTISWKTYLAVCVDRSWKVCRWYDSLSAKDVARIADLSKVQPTTKRDRDLLTNWLGRWQIPLLGRARFPTSAHSGWIVVDPQLEERRAIETAEAASLGLFVAELMHRTVSEFSYFAKMAVLEPAMSAEPSDAPDNVNQYGRRRQQNQAGEQFRESQPSQPSQPSQYDQFDQYGQGNRSGNRSSQETGGHDGPGRDDSEGAKEARWAREVKDREPVGDSGAGRPGNWTSETTTARGTQRDWTDGSRQARPPRSARPAPRVDDTLADPPHPSPSGTSERPSERTSERLEPLPNGIGLSASTSRVLQSACDELRGSFLYMDMVRYLLNARTDDHIAFLKSGVPKLYEADQRRRRFLGPLASPGSVHADVALRDLKTLLLDDTLSEAIIKHGLRTWIL